MPRTIPARAGLSSGSVRPAVPSLPTERWLTPFLVGVSVGGALGVLLVRLRAAEERGVQAVAEARGAGAAADRRWEVLTQAWEGAVESLVAARDALLGPGDIDLEALRQRLSGVPGAARVRVVAMGNGIVEVLGSVEDDATARSVVDLLAAQEGVDVVVNRIWSPSAHAPRDD